MSKKPTKDSPGKKKARAKLPQKERFIQAARDAEVDETGETFEKAVKTIIKSQ